MHGRRKKRQSRAGRISITFMVLALTAILSVQIVRLYHRDQAYQEQEALLEEQLSEEQERAGELEAQEEYIGSDEYVEDVARSKLGMVYEDEILFREE
ncbi:MAG: septum formation initiator family protein [Lachnospiraceae bacterium]|nr:septum formation initiator family protein [Lachnospiraceae bacterium]